MKTITLMTVIFIFLSAGSLRAWDNYPDNHLQIGFALTGVKQDASQMRGNGIGLGVEGYFRYPVSEKFRLSAAAGIHSASDDLFRMNIQKTVFLPTLELKVEFQPFSFSIINPFFYTGLQAYSVETKIKTADGMSGSGTSWSGGGIIGFGIQVPLERLPGGFELAWDYRNAFFESVNPKPQYWVGKAGLFIELGKKSKPPGMRQKTKPFENEEHNAYDMDLQNSINELKQQTQENTKTIQKLDNRMMKIEGIDKDIQIRAYENEQPVLSPGTSYEALYKKGLDAFDSVEYQNAIYIFYELLERDKTHGLASNCYYWIGESYFALGQYPQALQYFDNVFEYPKSNKLDDSLLKKGLCYMNMKQYQNAKEMLELLIRTYPGSEYIPRANQYLNMINSPA